jgi:hypothetical protein
MTEICSTQRKILLTIEGNWSGLNNFYSRGGNLEIEKVIILTTKWKEL